MLPSGTNRGYAIANSDNGQSMSMLLIDDTDPSRQQDFIDACASGKYRIVLVTIGQGEPSTTHFTCPPGNNTASVGIREWYPFWSGKRQLPYTEFPCNTLGWVSQSVNWAWPDSPPATADQSASEYETLTRQCPRLGQTHGLQGTF